MNSTQFDAVVIGAGAGGLFTAARLAHHGYRTLVVERLDKVGGRASTDDIDGFKVNTGAIVIEVGAPPSRSAPRSVHRLTSVNPNPHSCTGSAAKTST